MAEKGLIQVYTGNGKGKTTSAIGQAIRAAGHGHKVCFIYFLKNLQDYKPGEIEGMQKMGIRILNFVPKSPLFYKDINASKLRKQCLNAVGIIKKEIFGDKTIDLLILDEINIITHYSYIKEEEILSFLKDKPEKLEIILTGRGASQGLLEHADLVSKIEKIKHPFDKGIKAREGMEY